MVSIMNQPVDLFSLRKKKNIWKVVTSMTKQTEETNSNIYCGKDV